MADTIPIQTKFCVKPCYREKEGNGTVRELDAKYQNANKQIYIERIIGSSLMR